MTMKMRGLEVQQGCVKVSSIEIACRRPGVLILHASMYAKYAEVCAYSGREIWLATGEYTLHAEEGIELPTVITLPEFTSERLIQADVSKYLVTIVAYKPRPILWQPPRWVPFRRRRATFIFPWEGPAWLDNEDAC